MFYINLSSWNGKFDNPKVIELIKSRINHLLTRYGETIMIETENSDIASGLFNSLLNGLSEEKVKCSGPLSPNRYQEPPTVK